MKTLDAVTLMKKLRSMPPRDKEWYKEHEDELSDILYDEWLGRVESWLQGSALGSSNALKGSN